MYDHTQEPLYVAHSWIDTDRQSVADDIRRLGLRGAAQFNRAMIEERAQAGDRRWLRATTTALMRAFREEFADDDGRAA